MNYFAHGRDFVDRPYFLAGTAIPDWLNVVDRRVRVRSPAARRFVGHTNPRIAEVAGGIVRHHLDDRWFHATRTFVELSLHFTIAIRDLLPQDNGFRPSFLGHILVEILLDAALIEQHPRRLDQYYAAIESVDSAVIADTVEQISARSVDQMTAFMARFSKERFLYDYLDDEKLLGRLNQVMLRVKLPRLPHSIADFLPHARQQVKQQQSKLLNVE